MTSKAWRKERSFPSSLTFHPRRRRLAALSPEPAALTACPRVYRLGRPRARRGSRLTSAARVSSARAPVRSSVRSAVERDKQWQRHSARNADGLRSTALRAGTYLPPGTESSNPPSSSSESATNPAPLPAGTGRYRPDRWLAMRRGALEKNYDRLDEVLAATKIERRKAMP